MLDETSRNWLSNCDGAELCQYRTPVHDVIKKCRIPLQTGCFLNIYPIAYFEMKLGMPWIPADQD
jgi:hypothetical protein